MEFHRHRPCRSGARRSMSLAGVAVRTILPPIGAPMSSSAPSPEHRDDSRDPAPGNTPALTVLSRDVSTALPPVRSALHPLLTGPVAGILMGNAITFIGATFQ